MPRTPLQVCIFTAHGDTPPPPLRKILATRLCSFYFGLNSLRSETCFVFTPAAPNNLRRLSDFTILLRHRIHRASLDFGESQTRETGFVGVKDFDCKCVFSFSWSHQKPRRNDSKTNARAVFWFVRLRPLVIWSEHATWFSRKEKCNLVIFSY